MPGDRFAVALYWRETLNRWIASGRDADICTFGVSQVDALDRLRRALDDEEKLAKELGERDGLRRLPKPPVGVIPVNHKLVVLERNRGGRWSA